MAAANKINRNVGDDIPPHEEGQWLRATTDCFPLELGRTGLDSSAYDGELTGASLSTATKHKTAGVLTSEEPAHGSTPETSGTQG